MTLGGVAATGATAVAQLRLEGIGMRQKSLEMGVNVANVYRQFHSRGYGAMHVYTGFQAALASRLSFLGVRNMVYKTIYDMKKPPKPTNDLTYREKISISGFASALGAIAMNPFEIIRIRQTGDLGRAAQFQRGYSNLGEALNSVSLEKAGYWRGLQANMLRMTIMGTVMIWPYDRIKEHSWNAFGDVFVNRVFALIVASGFGAACTLPIDNIRTRLMNQNADASLNRFNYKTIAEVIAKSTVVEGQNALFVGMVPHYFPTLLYATLTIYFTDAYLTARKRGAGLEEHQI